MKKISFVILGVLAIMLIMGDAISVSAEQLICDLDLNEYHSHDCHGIGGTFVVVKLEKSYQCKSTKTGFLYNVSTGGLAGGLEVHESCDFIINVVGGKPEGTYVGQTLDVSGFLNFGGSFPMVALHWSNLIPHHFIQFIGWGGLGIGASVGVAVFVTIERVGGNDSPQVPAWFSE